MHFWRTLVFIPILTLAAWAQPGPAPARPAYLELRWDENWSYLWNHTYRTDYLDPLKNIDLGHPGWYMALGGESRTRYELFRSAGFGAVANSPNGFLIQRFLGHTDIHMGQMRFFVQAQSGLETGRLQGPRATDKDQFEIHQGFVELSTSGDAKQAVTFRLGRQEPEFGSGHFMSASEVFNVRRSFDAARVYWKEGNYTWNFLVARPVELNPGVFDNSPDHNQSLWAGGIFGPNPLIKKTNVSLYYLGYDRKFAPFDKGSGRETRHSVGSRQAPAGGVHAASSTTTTSSLASSGRSGPAISPPEQSPRIRAIRS
jgi:Alginate export